MSCGRISPAAVVGGVASLVGGWHPAVVRCQVSELFWWSLSPGIGGVGASVVSVSGDVDLEQLRRAAERFRADREDVDDWRLTTRQRWVNACSPPWTLQRLRIPAGGTPAGKREHVREFDGVEAVAAGAGHRGQKRRRRRSRRPEVSISRSERRASSSFCVVELVGPLVTTAPWCGGRRRRVRRDRRSGGGWRSMWMRRSSSMKRSAMSGPPSASWARMVSSGVVGSQRAPQAPAERSRNKFDCGLGEEVVDLLTVTGNRVAAQEPCVGGAAGEMPERCWRCPRGSCRGAREASCARRTSHRGARRGSNGRRATPWSC